MLNQGATVSEACRKIGVTEQTYYRWRKEYGGMRLEQARRLEDIEKENARLKRIVTQQALGNELLRLINSTYYLGKSPQPASYTRLKRS